MSTRKEDLAELDRLVSQLPEMRQPEHCPKCRSTKVAPIRFGTLGRMTDQELSDARAGKFIPAGTVIMPYDWGCLECGHCWEDKTDPAWQQRENIRQQIDEIISRYTKTE